MDDDAQLFEQLQTSARAWFGNHGGLSADHGRDEKAIATRWRAMADLGWSGIYLAETHGGFGLGGKGMAVLLQEQGRTLTASPLLASALVGAAVIRHSTAQHQQRLSLIVQGEARIAVAIYDPRPHSAKGRTVVASREANGWRLNGEHCYVLDGSHADHLIVATETETGTQLFLALRGEYHISPLDMIDGRDWAKVTFNNSFIGDDRTIEGGAAFANRICDLARLGLATEMLGAAEQALDITMEYLRTRVQFDRPIGTFQALQHRSAQMLIDLELARACIASAWTAHDDDTPDQAALANLAKVMAGKALHRITSEMVQMHGGIGMTAEHLAGRFLKWARVSEVALGSSDLLTDRYAAEMRF